MKTRIEERVLEIKIFTNQVVATWLSPCFCCDFRFFTLENGIYSIIPWSNCNNNVLICAV